MALADRTKTALDESRMMMLGAQILLGFQLQAPFQDGFSKVSSNEKAVELVVLGLIIVVVGLLITPSAHHRIAEDGEAGSRFIEFLTRVSVATLPAFAIAIGLDLGLAGTRIAGLSAGIVGAVLGAALPLAIWFGPLLFHHPSEEETMPTSDKKTPLDAKIDYVLTEARVVLPGAQALLGFQLAIVLTNSFEQLSPSLKEIHGLALGLIALATALLIAPAAYHRLVYAGRNEPEFHRLASRFLLLATVFLALGLATDTYVVVSKIIHHAWMAASSAITVAVLLLGLWHIWPWWRRSAVE
ncbi:DUF6328 family protein [Bosea sp. TAF32]|uniref:DUF6328 family protein n=1 Tax=Bosea sp. TAF32 TaxID=3237482 RepID=UPI003F8E5158